jgi:Ca2+-binding RTX toxin-like protein
MRGTAPYLRAFPALALLAILAFPALVSGSQDVAITSGPQGSVLTITGDDAAEKVTLTPAGSDLAVKGFFDGPTPPQCTVVTDRKIIQCPFSAFSSVSVDLAGGNDALIVSATLPVPLSADMGDGTNGFTGLDEPDTCIGGADSDSCVTGGGDDVCSTGAGADHCTMGAGRDSCTLGPGDDGCGAGAGPDTCRGEGGADRCKGEGGPDLLYGGPGHDGEIGGPGRDKCDPTPGHDVLNDCEVVLR